MKVNKQLAEQNTRPSLHRQCKYQYPYFKRKGHKNLIDLPNEILLEVFSYLPTYDLYTNVRPVCRRFMGLAAARPLWVNVKVPEHVSTNMLARWLHDFGHHVRHLSTADRVDGNEMFKQVAKCCKELESISAVNVGGTDSKTPVKAAPLCNMITRCKRLRRIKLRGCSFMSCRFFKLLSTYQSSRAATRGPLSERMRRRFEYDGPISRKQLFSLYESLNQENLLHNCLVVLNRKSYKVCINMQKVQNLVNLSRKTNIMESLWCIVNKIINLH